MKIFVHCTPPLVRTDYEKKEKILEEFLIKLERLESNKQLPVIDCKIKFQANGMITSSNTRFPESMLQGTRTRGRGEGGPS